MDLIIFGAVAAFLVWRLWSTLGRRTGNEQTRPDPFSSGGEDEASGNVIPLPERNRGDDDIADAPTGSTEDDMEEGVIAIRRVDANFSPSDFLAGARGAFELIVMAFARGEKETLRPMLSDDVFNNFAAAIDDREGAGETLETTLVGVRSAKLTRAELQGRTAFVSVSFVTEQINLVKDADGRILDGDPNAVEEVRDTWTFARNTRSRDPNWTLVATETDTEAEEHSA